MWKQQRKVHSDLISKKPLYKKLEENSRIQNDKNDEIRQKILKERKTQFKPILQGEIEEFAEKVDMIVSHMNVQRREERDKILEGDCFDPKQLRSQTYQKVVHKDKLQKQHAEMEI
jgi:hypothetical protein